MRLYLTALLALVTLAVCAPADAAIRVDSTREARAAIDRIGNRAGTIVLERGRYSTLRIGPRSPRARWLTIVARPGALTKSVIVARARRVRLVGLQVTNYWGSDARLYIVRSARVELERLTVEGSPGRMARVRVYRSTRVSLRNSDLSRCGDRPGADCLAVPYSRYVTVADSAFHDCYGCDFVRISRVRGMRLVRSTFDRALPGPCDPRVSTQAVEASLDAAGPVLPGVCNHQDLVQVSGAHNLTIEDSRFGVYQYGAAQLYISGMYPVVGLTVRRNLFQLADAAVPDVEAITGIIVGNPGGTSPLPLRVLLEENVIESGAIRDPAVFRYWQGVANGLILTERYATLDPALRPVVVRNAVSFLSHPGLVCGLATTDLPC